MPHPRARRGSWGTLWAMSHQRGPQQTGSTPQGAVHTQPPDTSPQNLLGNAAINDMLLGSMAPLLGLIGCGQGGLDRALDAAAVRSSTLAGALDGARRAGWSFVEGPAGGGTNSNRDTRTVTIDRDTLEDPDALARSLSHELGHVLDGPPAYVYAQAHADAWDRNHPTPGPQPPLPRP